MIVFLGEAHLDKRCGCYQKNSRPKRGEDKRIGKET